MLTDQGFEILVSPKDLLSFGMIAVRSARAARSFH